MKFGGSSVADADNWPRIATEAAKVLDDGGNAVIVVSALDGITDLLDACLQSPGEIEPGATLAEVRRRHESLAASADVELSALEPIFESLRETLERVGNGDADPAIAAELLAFGELLSSRLGEIILHGQGLDCQWLDSRELLVCNDNPNRSRRAVRLSAECEVAPSPDTQSRLAARGRLFIAPGFIARNGAGDTVLLGRGGSDISAALIGTLLVAMAADTSPAAWSVRMATFAAVRRFPYLCEAGEPTPAFSTSTLRC